MEMQMFKNIFFGSSVGLSGTSQAVITFLLFPVCFTWDFRTKSVFPNTLYLWAWNAPTEVCHKNHNVTIDLRFFSLVGSPQKTATGQSITVFHFDNFGLYPYVNSKKQSINGGIPQKANLRDHLTKASKDLDFYLPKDNLGLAVINWQEWRPLWLRSWKPNDIYRKLSVNLVKQNNAGINDVSAYIKAQLEYESLAKNFMVATLKLVKRLRPRHYWGYYLFPDCYNYHYAKPGYDGHCPEIEMKKNDQLSWMWEESTALYPSIYLNTELNSSRHSTLFARNQVWEAIRVSRVRNAVDPLPVFVYTNPIFTDTSGEYLTQEHLVSTIGESIALGASGIIMGGSLNLSQSVPSCLKLNNYMKTTLYPYIINVTLAAKMCSQVLCYDQGLCTRKNWDSDNYLHLNPINFSIEFGYCERYIVSGEPSISDFHAFSANFDCSCFSNTTCKRRGDIRTLELVHVCMVEDLCITSFVKPKLTNNHSI